MELASVTAPDFHRVHVGGRSKLCRRRNNSIRADYLAADVVLSETIPENRVVVRSASDLVNIDSNKIYLIDGKIDIGNSTN